MHEFLFIVKANTIKTEIVGEQAHNPLTPPPSVLQDQLNSSTSQAIAATNSDSNDAVSKSQLSVDTCANQTITSTTTNTRQAKPTKAEKHANIKKENLHEEAATKGKLASPAENTNTNTAAQFKLPSSKTENPKKSAHEPAKFG